MKILAVETATEACSAALYNGVDSLERYQFAPREHNHLILPMIESLLAEAQWQMRDIEGLAFGAGPGSFTGVRIATGVIQGLALGLDLRVVGVSTLAALAEDGMREMQVEHALAAIDARMGEVYWGVYRKSEQGQVIRVGDEVVIDPEQVPIPSEAFALGVGSGWGTYRDVLSARLQRTPKQILPDRFPRARAVARLGFEGFRQGLDVPVTAAQPTYLRDNVAKKPTCKV
jgi:tRNA threonylcarbamoyladenosine biosynthesis protein TsaB